MRTLKYLFHLEINSCLVFLAKKPVDYSNVITDGALPQIQAQDRVDFKVIIHDMFLSTGCSPDLFCYSSHSWTYEVCRCGQNPSLCFTFWDSKRFWKGKSYPLQKKFTLHLPLAAYYTMGTAMIFFGGNDEQQSGLPLWRMKKQRNPEKVSKLRFAFASRR